jgi:hypothetical protein
VKLPASAIVLVLLGSACGHNGADQVSTPFVPAPAAQTSGFVTLSGTVTDGTSGAPIAAAGVGLLYSPSLTTFASTTDENGHYQISNLPNLPNGLQSWVTASAMGYLQPCAAQLALHGDTTVNLQLVSSAALSISSNAPSSRIPGTRNAAGFVYRIAADGRHPVPGVFVALQGPFDSDATVSTTITDSTGHYALCGLPMNEEIFLEAYYGTMVGSGAISISAGATDAVADITLGP